MFDAVHVGAFPTKTRYPLLERGNGLFGDGEILQDKIIKNTKHLLYRFIAPKEKSELRETVDTTHGAAVHMMLELQGEGCKEKNVKECNRNLLTNVIPFMTRSVTTNSVANNLNYEKAMFKVNWDPIPLPPTLYQKSKKEPIGKKCYVPFDCLSNLTVLRQF